jgi:hypothetical protein
MKPEVIDVTGLSPQQIAMLKEIVAAFGTILQQRGKRQSTIAFSLSPTGNDSHSHL